MVEQEFCKLQVVGSIPITSIHGGAGFIIWGDSFPCTEEVASSILVAPPQSPITQLVEWVTVNHLVAGSSPSVVPVERFDAKQVISVSGSTLDSKSKSRGSIPL